MSVRIRFIISDKAVTGNTMWVMVGLILVILGAVIFTYLSYYLGAQLDPLQYIKYWLCQITNGSWCDDDTRVMMSVEALSKGINYICSDGSEKVDSSFTTCDGSGSDAKCSVYFFLPQATTSIEDWIPGAGDPKYLVYHEAFPPGEDTAWSGWQTVSMALMAIPFVKTAGGPLKEGLKDGFVIGKESFVEAFRGTLATKGLGTAIKETPDIVAVGFKEGLKSEILKEGVENAVKKGTITISGGITASEATKYAISSVEKFIPCDTNSLCVKSAFTVRSQYVQPKAVPLSTACKGTYIELNKLLEIGTKFYLASPCNARLDIQRGKCNCVPDVAELGGKEMAICSQYSIMPNYQSDCIKITPHEIKTGKENFCYTPPKVFGYAATGLSWGSDLGLQYCFVTTPTGVGAVACYGLSGTGKVISMWLESRTAWPHGFLEAE